MTFDRPVAGSLDRTVDPKSVFRISPGAPGRLEWRDLVTIRLIPDKPLKSGTSYTVTIANSFEAMDGSRLEAPFRFSFSVTGPKALTGLPTHSVSGRALERYPDRFVPSCTVDPNEGMDAVRKLDEAVRVHGAKATHCWGTGLIPQVPLDDKKMYPIYAKCVELDIPIFVYAGVPGPRIRFEPQYVGLLDEVCWFFPELKFVMRHGAEPWDELAVKLMLKWPNLYYSTSAFAPRYYPESIVHYANTRGADKVMYAGYFPMGLSLERIFSELPNVAFKDDVWPKFLRENATRVFAL